jgi:hypothetical protein
MQVKEAHVADPDPYFAKKLEGLIIEAQAAAARLGHEIPEFRRSLGGYFAYGRCKHCGAVAKVHVISSGETESWGNCYDGRCTPQ